MAENYGAGTQQRRQAVAKFSEEDVPEKYRKFVIRVQGNMPYMTVAGLVMMFRDKHPEGSIQTYLLEHQAGKWAMFKAAISIPDSEKPLGEAHAIQTMNDHADFYEKCECVPTDVQILTREGWKFHHELIEGELVLSYDNMKDKAEWVPLEMVTTYNNANVVRLYNGWGFDVLCTDEHTWATFSRTVHNGKEYQYRKLVKTNKLPKGGAIVTASPAPSGELFDITPKLAAVMGWLMTDGGFKRTGKCLRGVIYQSKPNRVKEIRDLLDGSGLTYTECARQSGYQNLPGCRRSFCMESFQWWISADSMRRLYMTFGISHETELETVIPSLTEDARASMLSAMLHADGTDTGDFGKKRKPWVMPVFQCLCALQGVALSKYKFSTQGCVPIQRYKRTCHTYLSSINKEDAGNMDVWCPTTRHGTWYARFPNGVITITGNTKAIGRALRNAGFGTDFGSDEEELSHNRPVDAPISQDAQGTRTASDAQGTRVSSAGNGKFKQVQNDGPIGEQGGIPVYDDGEEEPQATVDKKEYDKAKMLFKNLIMDWKGWSGVTPDQQFSIYNQLLGRTGDTASTMPGPVEHLDGLNKCIDKIDKLIKQRERVSK